MNPQVEFNLALILFLPWFGILAALYWIYPRQPRTTARRAYDAVALAIASALAAWGMHWSMLNADPHAGAIWKQVLASSISYGLFLLVMTIALIARFRLFKAPRPNASR
ncbi:hypothetical protein ACFQZQ_03540 [Lysobacter koreensis]|uniref:Transmembrane protein n=1 Tax=Lysobacter koreensis TaxID=266122 RepID=A0ABW2YMJ1_9GAMM